MKKKTLRDIKDKKLKLLIKENKREGIEKDFLELLTRAVKK